VTIRAHSLRRAARALRCALVVPVVVWSCAKPAPPAPAPRPATTPPQQRAAGSDTLRTFTGIKYVVVQAGSGARLRAGRTAIVHYTGMLSDGTKFDSSRDRGTPFEFTLGTRAVIAGWDELIALLQVGDRVTCVIPPDLAYGAKGSPPTIPPNATLIFDIELLGMR
jgi:peptidylprolyl isomerase